MSLRERLTHLNSMRLWLTPGMGVKRHVLVAGVGMVILIGGAIAGLLWLFSGNRQVLSAPIEAVLVSDSWDRLGSWLSLLVILAGLAMTVLAIQRLNRSLLSNWTSHPEGCGGRATQKAITGQRTEDCRLWRWDGPLQSPQGSTESHLEPHGGSDGE